MILQNVRLFGRSGEMGVLGVVTRNYQISDEILSDSALESHRLLVTISKPVISQHSSSRIIFYILTFQEKTEKSRKKPYFASIFCVPLHRQS